MATIEFSHVSKVFGQDTKAVKNFNLRVEDGEFIAIIGSSGCGKSTLLRMVAGLENITTGEVLFDGRVVNDLPPKKRNVAMVFQNYALFPNLTVEDNLGFALKMQRVPKKERRQRVAEMAETLHITPLLKRKAKGLSGGQCQRIAIGRALVCRPSVFLLDEPLSNLDANIKAELQAEISRLHKEFGTTTIYVTHDHAEAMSLSNRLVVMHDGELQQVDTPQNIYFKPQNVFVSQFAADSVMNFIPVHCEVNGPQATLRHPAFSAQLPDWKAQALIQKGYAGKPVTLGIRAEDIFPVQEGLPQPPGDTIVVPTTVAGIDVLGTDKRLRLELEGGQPLIALTRTSAQAAPQDRLDATLAVSRFHLFDPETESAIVH